MANTRGLEVAPRWRPATVVSKDGRNDARPTGWAAVRARTYRGLNAGLAALLLVLLSPIMLVIALLIRMTSRGPVIYRQRRVGLDRRGGRVPAENHQREVDYGGRLFDIYKFRTMHNGADDVGQVWATPADPRITHVGRILRLYRLDELPQLFNVVKGDMNIVGPRPEQPEIALVLRAEIDGYYDRHRVPPGITGWAQINLHYDRNIEDVRRKVALDLEYIERQSVAEDVSILLRTVPVVLFKRGAC